MPIVDHEERRQKIAQVATDIISREGLDAATVRRIAAELDVSTRSITHYFADKHELLLWVYRFIAEQAESKFEKIVAKDPADLVGGLWALSAIDTGSRIRWRVYIAFWDRGARDSVIASQQHLALDRGLEWIGTIVRARNPDRTDTREVAQLLIAFVHGISLQAIFDPESWRPERIRKTLADQVETILGSPSGR